MNREQLYAPVEVNRWQSIALGIGAIFTIVWAVGTFFNTEQGLRSWLLGFIFWGGISIGSLGILILQYLTGGAWGLVIRRILEASTRVLPLVALMFIPIIVFMSTTYGWANPDPSDEILKWRAIYLNPTSFGVRAIIYFAIWFLFAYLYNSWSAQQDATTNAEDAAALLGKSTAISGPAMVIFGLVVTFASIDWTMSLDKHWFSTIWGMLYIAGWGLSGFAFTIALCARLIEREPMSSILGKKHFHDLGKLMLALVMIWAYFNFSQFLIIYSGNIPEETPWYLMRMKGPWGILGILLIVFHFAFPFLLLLSRDLKRNTKRLSWVAIFILVMRLLDMYYQIGPNAYSGEDHGGAFHLSWLDFVAPIGIGGLWLAYFFHELKKRPLIPPQDPFIDNAIKHGRGH